MTAVVERIMNPLSAYPLAVIECGVVAVAFALALLAPPALRRWLDGAERGFAQLARRRAASIALAALAALALRAAVLPVSPIPDPHVHDEFSNLLAADTFAAGRLANPPHPHWEHFETFHVLQQPTYASKYPSAQGLVMALGQKLFGHPWYGVWLSMGLMSAALCWALQGWLPPRWALFGALVVAARLCVFSYWVNTYYGGAVTAAGGALVVGALPRLLRRWRARDAFAAAAGLTVLANSRPFEGALCAALLGAAPLWRIARGSVRVPRGALARIVLPGAAVLAVTAAAMAFQYWRVTGSPLRMPYHVYQQANDPVPLFVWQEMGPMPDYRHAAMGDFMAWTLPMYERGRTPRGVAVRLAEIVSAAWLFFVGPALTIALVASPLLLHDKRVRFLIFVLAAFLLALLSETYFSLHYAAPVIGIIYVLLLQSLRHLYVWRRGGRAIGRRLVQATAVVCLVMFGVRALARPLKLGLDPNSWRAANYYAGGFGERRARVAAALEAAEGHHLVFVRYGAGHRAGEEWVYNRARIDEAKIVWAREMSPAENGELIEYFRDRRVWLLEPDENPPRLSAYQTGGSSGAAEPSP